MSTRPPYSTAPGVHRPGDYRTPDDPTTGRTKLMAFSYKSAAVICYLPLCCCLIGVISSLVWLGTEPVENRFLRFHSIQGLLLAAVSFAVMLIFRLLGAGARLSSYGATGSAAVGFGAALLIDLIALLFLLPLLIVHIVAMVKAGQGEAWKLPVIGDIAERKA